MNRPIKFRGADMNGNFVYGLLTKKKIRSSGEIRWAIATGNCSQAETVPVRENSIAQLVGFDRDGREVYEGDIVTNFFDEEFTAEILDGVITSEGAVDFVGGVEVLKLKEADNAHN